MEAGSLPSGEWLCRKCNPPELPQELRQVNKPFQSLLERDVRENPVSFSLPSYLLSNSPLGLGAALWSVLIWLVVAVAAFVQVPGKDGEVVRRAEGNMQEGSQLLGPGFLLV